MEGPEIQPALTTSRLLFCAEEACDEYLAGACPVRRSELKVKASSGHAPLPPILLRLAEVLVDIAKNQTQAPAATDKKEDNDGELQNPEDSPGAQGVPL